MRGIERKKEREKERNKAGECKKVAVRERDRESVCLVTSK